ncbi:MAG: DUF6456 domain-containing protein [Alphaproteobacteria bacterium]|nr:DUF6456 domain-containing protein [Alphaproteobacteria bacterium]MDX5369174.1 DUF6456 domain-containing protein [Alphaproteobacteria bacterium]MDX5463870.1 DUF6456 domain-containing protein [Alphaproteobacteria bacterium]
MTQTSPLPICTPLRALARKTDAHGKPFLDPCEIEAGERFAFDFLTAARGPRVTQAWPAAPAAAGRRGPPEAPAMTREAAARARLGKALQLLGPGLGDIVLAVCGQEEGLASAEERLGWPRRSAKLVLKLALARLARHYGLAMRAPGPAPAAPMQTDRARP